METFTSVDDKYDYWKTLFLSIIDNLVKVRMKKDSCEWIDEDIRRLMRARNYYRRKYQKMRNPEDWKMFKGLRNEVNRQMRQAKVGHFSRLCQELSNKPRKVWRQLNLSLGRKVKRLVTSLKCIDRTLTASSDIVNEFLHHFSNPPTSPATAPNKINSVPTVFHFSDIKEDKVRKLLATLDGKKATGPDNISARLLRMVAPAISDSITSLLNTCLSLGEFPSIWKQANVTPKGWSLP